MASSFQAMFSATGSIYWKLVVSSCGREIYHVSSIALIGLTEHPKKKGPLLE